MEAPNFEQYSNVFLLGGSIKFLLLFIILQSDRFNEISHTERIAGSFEHNFGSVSNSLGRIAAASERMASLCKIDQAMKWFILVLSGTMY